MQQLPLIPSCVYARIQQTAKSGWTVYVTVIYLPPEERVDDLLVNRRVIGCESWTKHFFSLVEAQQYQTEVYANALR